MQQLAAACGFRLSITLESGNCRHALRSVKSVQPHYAIFGHFVGLCLNLCTHLPLVTFLPQQVGSLLPLPMRRLINPVRVRILFM
jgi:hypothetical protein